MNDWGIGNSVRCSTEVSTWDTARSSILLSVWDSVRDPVKEGLKNE